MPVCLADGEITIQTARLEFNPHRFKDRRSEAAVRRADDDSSHAHKRPNAADSVSFTPSPAAGSLDARETATLRTCIRWVAKKSRTAAIVIEAGAGPRSGI